MKNTLLHNTKIIENIIQKKNNLTPKVKNNLMDTCITKTPVYSTPISISKQPQNKLLNRQLRVDPVVRRPCSNRLYKKKSQVYVYKCQLNNKDG